MTDMAMMPQGGPGTRRGAWFRGRSGRGDITQGGRSAEVRGQGARDAGVQQSALFGREATGEHGSERAGLFESTGSRGSGGARTRQDTRQDNGRASSGGFLSRLIGGMGAASAVGAVGALARGAGETGGRAVGNVGRNVGEKVRNVVRDVTGEKGGPSSGEGRERGPSSEEGAGRERGPSSEEGAGRERGGRFASWRAARHAARQERRDLHAERKARRHAESELEKLHKTEGELRETIEDYASRPGRLSSISVGMLTGIATGAALMYFFDAGSGARRRNVLRDRVGSTWTKTRDALETARHDVRNRVQGRMQQGRNAQRALAEGWTEWDDTKLAARVRSRLGHIVSNAHAIEVSADQGEVTLLGPVLTSEAGRLVRRVRMIRGVRRVNDLLDRHAVPDHPSLQGADMGADMGMGTGTGTGADLGSGSSRGAFGRAFSRPFAGGMLGERWPPAWRMAAGVAGGALVLRGLGKRSMGGSLLGFAGIGLILRALYDRPVSTVVGLRGEGRLIDVQKSIRIEAPVERVFEFWQSFSNWPQFMSHLEEVKERGELSHWVAAGPMGIRVHWDSIVTEKRPNEFLAWTSAAGSQVDHAGFVRFERDGDGTRVHVQMYYNPPGGALGHAVASLFGADPKRALDDDLGRMKSILERQALPGEERFG